MRRGRRVAVSLRMSVRMVTVRSVVVAMEMNGGHGCL